MKISTTHIACLLLLLTGCSKPLTSIEGTVSYRGVLLKEGRIYFNVNDGESVASAEIDPNGKYEVRQILPGTAQVAVVISPPPSLPDSDMPATSASGKGGNSSVTLPTKYAKVNTSGISTEVASGKNTYDLKLE